MENFRGERDALLSWSGGEVPPFLPRARSIRRLLLTRRGIFCLTAYLNAVAFLPSVDVHQRDHGAIDFVLGCAIRPHPQRVRTAFLVSHFALARTQRFDYLAQNIFQVGNINVMSQLA